MACSFFGLRPVGYATGTQDRSKGIIVLPFVLKFTRQATDDFDDETLMKLHQTTCPRANSAKTDSFGQLCDVTASQALPSDGRSATTNDDYSVRVYSFAIGTCLQKLHGHDANLGRPDHARKQRSIVGKR
jgi:hypothetical protein